MFKSLILFVAVAAAGCAQLGVETPQTCNEKVAASITAVTTARQTVTVALQAKKLTADDAENLQNQADTARAGVAIARGLCATDATGAVSRLDIAKNVLTGITAYLSSKQGK